MTSEVGSDSLTGEWVQRRSRGIIAANWIASDPGQDVRSVLIKFY
jgi:hypothetical protein